MWIPTPSAGLRIHSNESQNYISRFTGSSLQKVDEDLSSECRKLHPLAMMSGYSFGCFVIFLWELF